jgi:hypothetical protein
MATRYFGAKPGFGPGHVIAGVLVSALAVGAVTFEYLHVRAIHVATAKAWDIQGPPCPALTEAEFAARRWAAPKTFDYDGVTLGRAAGDASCSDVKTGGGTGFGTDKVCQFTSPAALTVAVKGTRYFFLPGVGQPATIAIHHDTPRCVMASKFTLQNEN